MILDNSRCTILLTSYEIAVYFMHSTVSLQCNLCDMLFKIDTIFRPNLLQNELNGHEPRIEAVCQNGQEMVNEGKGYPNKISFYTVIECVKFFSSIATVLHDFYAFNSL